jgi:hypothetical protein
MSPRALTHEQAWELIPWIANERIGGDEREAALAHLSECASCRDELDAQQRLRTLMRQPRNIDYSPGPSLQKLLWRLDEVGDARNVMPPARAQRARPAHRWPRWMALAQAAAIAALAVALMFQVLGRSAPAYRTVTEPRPGNAALRIVFAPDTTVRDMQRLLSAAGTLIVDGPSPAGVYSLALPPGAGTEAAERAAEDLRSAPQVLFVEAQPP